MVHKGKGKRYMSRERFSIKTKLIASHGAIGLLPMILVMLLVLSTAKSGIMDEVKGSVGYKYKNSDEPKYVVSVSRYICRIYPPRC